MMRPMSYLVLAILSVCPATPALEIVSLSPVSGMAVAGDTVSLTYVESRDFGPVFGEVTLTLVGAPAPAVITPPQAVVAGQPVNVQFTAPAAGTYDLTITIFGEGSTGRVIVASLTEPYIIASGDLSVGDARQLLLDRMDAIIATINAWGEAAARAAGADPARIRAPLAALAARRDGIVGSAEGVLRKTRDASERIAVVLDNLFEFHSWLYHHLGEHVDRVHGAFGAACTLDLTVDLIPSLIAPEGEDVLSLVALTNYDSDFPPVQIDQLLSVEILSPIRGQPRVFDGVIDFGRVVAGAGDVPGQIRFARDFESDGRGSILKVKASLVAIGIDSDPSGLCLRIEKADLDLPGTE